MDELTEQIEWLELQGFSKRLIHIVDHEADSVGHLRQWQAADRYWMVRVKAGSTVSYAGQRLRLNQVASQACALVWQLMRAKGKLTQQTRSLLLRLSGRQMKHSQPVTASALLSGLYMLLAMCDTLAYYTPAELRAFAEEAIGLLPIRRL